MSSNISSINDAKPHSGGEAHCVACKYEWVAVALVGTTQLECPRCGTWKGLFKYPFNVVEGELLHYCNCGNDLFRITPKGHLCINCGILQSY